VINFDEFIQLKDINQQLVVSPPLKKKPPVRIKNKSVIVNLEGLATDSSTYTLNFGEAIVDNNEGTPIRDFQFVFTRGDKLDSLSLKGRVTQAFTLQPNKESVTVMLYKNLNDTAPSRSLPDYVGKTNSDGYYSINNIHEGIYRLYAVVDDNTNLKYEQSIESFAFADTLVILKPEFIKRIVDPRNVADSVARAKAAAEKKDDKKDKKKADKPEKKLTAADSAFRYAEGWGISADLRLSKELPVATFLHDKSRKERRQISLIFNRNPYGFPKLNWIENPDTLAPWYILEKNKTSDTLTYWLTRPEAYNRDTMNVVLYYNNIKDGTLFTVADTTMFRFSDPKKPKRHKRDEDEEAQKPVVEYLNIAFNASQGKMFELDQKFEIQSAYPLQSADSKYISFYYYKDTLEVPEPFTLVIDSLNKRKAYLQFKVNENTKYGFCAYPGAFTSIYKTTNDTTQTQFTSREMNFYGILNLTLNKVKQPLIVQLMDGENVLYQKLCTKSDKLIFPMLQPKAYTLKVIIDRNGNGKWDGADFLAKQQPEEVFFYPEPVNIRSDWDVDVEWDVPASAY
jgi:hypothetical protein